MLPASSTPKRDMRSESTDTVGSVSSLKNVETPESPKKVKESQFEGGTDLKNSLHRQRSVGGLSIVTSTTLNADEIIKKNPALADVSLEDLAPLSPSPKNGGRRDSTKKKNETISIEGVAPVNVEAKDRTKAKRESIAAMKILVDSKPSLNSERRGSAFQMRAIESPKSALVQSPKQFHEEIVVKGRTCSVEVFYSIGVKDQMVIKARDDVWHKYEFDVTHDTLLLVAKDKFDLEKLSTADLPKFIEHVLKCLTFHRDPNDIRKSKLHFEAERISELDKPPSTIHKTHQAPSVRNGIGEEKSLPSPLQRAIRSREKKRWVAGYTNALNMVIEDNLRLLKRDPKSYTSARLIGLRFNEEGNILKAAAYLQYASQEKKDHPAAFWVSLAKLQMQMWTNTFHHSYLECAIEAYKEAMKHMEYMQDPGIRYELGKCYYIYGALEGALSVFSNIITEFPQYGKIKDIIWMSAVAMKQLGNLDEALEYFKHTLEDLPSTYREEHVLFVMASLYNAQGKRPFAQEAYSTIFRKFNPKPSKKENADTWFAKPDTWFNIALFFYKFRDFTVALEAYETGVRIATATQVSISPAILLEYANVLVALQRNEKAEEIASLIKELPATEGAAKLLLEQLSASYEPNKIDPTNDLDLLDIARDKSAIKIQAVMRGNADRKKVEKMKEEIAQSKLNEDLANDNSEKAAEAIKEGEGKAVEKAAEKAVETEAEDAEKKKKEETEKAEKTEAETVDKEKLEKSKADELEKEKKAKEEAAVKIQKVARGKSARKQVQPKLEAAKEKKKTPSSPKNASAHPIEAHPAREIDVSNNDLYIAYLKEVEAEQELAAVKIQKISRGRKVRREHKQKMAQRKIDEQIIFHHGMSSPQSPKSPQSETTITTIENNKIDLKELLKEDLVKIKRTGYAASKSSYELYWREVLAYVCKLFTSKGTLHRTIAEVQDAYKSRISHEVAFIALADCRGKASEAISNLSKADYVQEMHVVQRLIGKKDMDGYINMQRTEDATTSQIVSAKAKKFGGLGLLISDARHDDAEYITRIGASADKMNKHRGTGFIPKPKMLSRKQSNIVVTRLSHQQNKSDRNSHHIDAIINAFMQKR